MVRAALALASRGLPVVRCHYPVSIGGQIVCSCIHKPDPSDPTKCGCGHRRSTPNAPCSCGRPDCRVRCTGKPCAAIGKHPATAHGLKDATTDPIEIRTMFGNRPWNIAIVVGARARVFVFDLDRHAQGEDGIEAFQELCSELGIEQPDPVTSITGGGGLQLFFRHPGPEYHIGSRCGDNALRPGLEVKGDDSYVIVPPSLHRSGRRYAWQERADGAKSKILDCPPELLRLVVTGPRRARTIATGHAATSFLGRAFAAAHMLGPDLPESKAAVTCPWEHEHSDGKGSLSSTALLPPTINHPLGLFRCQHQHCARRGNVAVMQALPDEALAEAGLMDPQGFALAMNILAARAA